mmetsp:Transcript_87953/g.169287  ORF Transcript_87953/g.169287 Transcript_87953/m.169287 type:complete len:397 (-) Transcript_87953:155-1345(-)
MTATSGASTSLQPMGPSVPPGPPGTCNPPSAFTAFSAASRVWKVTKKRPNCPSASWASFTKPYGAHSSSTSRDSQLGGKAASSTYPCSSESLDANEGSVGLFTGWIFPPRGSSGGGGTGGSAAGMPNTPGAAAAVALTTSAAAAAAASVSIFDLEACEAHAAGSTLINERPKLCPLLGFHTVGTGGLARAPPVTTTPPKRRPSVTTNCSSLSIGSWSSSFHWLTVSMSTASWHTRERSIPSNIFTHASAAFLSTNLADAVTLCSLAVVETNGACSSSPKSCSNERSLLGKRSDSSLLIHASGKFRSCTVRSANPLRNNVPDCGWGRKGNLTKGAPTAREGCDGPTDPCRGGGGGRGAFATKTRGRGQLVMPNGPRPELRPVLGADRFPTPPGCIKQ